MQTDIAKHRKRVSYSKGIRKAAALAALAEALRDADIGEAGSTAVKALVLARKMLERLERDDKRRPQYETVLADALHAHAGCLTAEENYTAADPLMVEALALWEQNDMWKSLLPGLLTYSRILNNLGRSTEALRQIDVAVEVARQLRSRTFISELHALQAEALLYSGAPDRAAAAIDTALDAIKYVPEARRPTALAQVANVQHVMGLTPAAITSLENAEVLARKLGDKLLLLRLLYNLSAFRFIDDPASDYATPILEAVGLAQDLGNQQYEALLHEMYGVRAMRTGDYDRSIKEFSRARDLYRDLGGRAAILRILGWLGLVHYELGAADLGKEYLRKAAGFLKNGPLSEGWTSQYRIILENAPELLDLENLEELFSAEAERAHLDHDSGRIVIMLLLGYILELRGRLEEAAEAYHKVREMTVNFEVPCRESNAVLGLGRIERARGNFVAARKLMLEAFEIAENGCHEWQTKRRISLELADTAKKLGDYRAALDYRRRLHERELEIVLPQINNSVDQLLVAENAELLQLGYDEKLRHLETVRSTARVLQDGLESRALRARVEADRRREIGERIRREFLDVDPKVLSAARVSVLVRDTLAAMEAAAQSSVTSSLADFPELRGNELEQMRGRFPKLSATEARVCVSIRAGRSNRSIAELLSVSIRAVETYRYRIRKKLGMEQGQNLTEYLLAEG